MQVSSRSPAARALAALRRVWWKLVLPIRRVPLLREMRGRNLRRLQPFAGGATRGTAIVRHYWDEFLGRHRADLHGRCLEVGSTAAIRRFGRAAHAEALDLAARPGVTIVADLSRADAVPSDGFDCVVVPFTMHLIYDIDAALFHALRVLKPGGVLLVNFPCVDYYFADGLDMGTGRPLFMFWFFTPLQVENLLRRCGLTAGDYALTIDGNLFARVAYQMNLAAEELTADERELRDPGHPLLISARIVKPRAWHVERPAYREPWLPSTVPGRWSERHGHYPAR